MGKFSVFLENNRDGDNHQAAYRYENPVEMIIATTADELFTAFQRIKECMSDGFHVAGWISYEAGLCYEAKLLSLLPEKLDVPLLTMGVYKTREVIGFEDADHYWKEKSERSAFNLTNLSLSESREQYAEKFDKIQNYLIEGDIYQVNYTLKAKFDFAGSVKAFYASLRKAQQVEYAAFIESDDLTILSLSPELFVKKEGETLKAKPMKGTGRRGRSVKEDQELKQRLYNSPKDRAENLMIVDLLRNDLSKSAAAGTVKVPKLFEVEKYKTLFTMTSTIEAQVEEGTNACDVVTSIFPCGSITGAPKIRAQEVIAELESHQRGVYTGAIGYFMPDGDICFSVPIRTLTIDKSGQGELGLGGAIVADSKAEDEYDECLLKASFVTNEHPDFDIIESLRWSQSEGYPHLIDHLKRLEQTSNYFSFKCDIRNIRDALLSHATHLKCDKGEFYKVRLLLSKEGNYTITSVIIKTVNSKHSPIIVLSKEVINNQDKFFFHKTTRREFYQTQLETYKAKYGCHDVIFKNDKGELTEGSYTNLFIEKDGILYTPPVECGLLNGVYRQFILNKTDDAVHEKVLYQEDLESADAVYVANAVRGLQKVNFQLKLG
ncbi:MAG: aminodeoxychorismate synthase component I [Emcibacteraceae bacterium]|nr:aminodeoxychorismate synthase component I [Emcibacteraceae bacterium]